MATTRCRSEARAEVYFGRGARILKPRDEIKLRTIEQNADSTSMQHHEIQPDEPKPLLDQTSNCSENPGNGQFAAQAAAGITIFGASGFGIPLSTTHTITSAIAGVAASRRTSDIRWPVLLRIVLAWIITFPVCFAAAYVAARLVS